MRPRWRQRWRHFHASGQLTTLLLFLPPALVLFTVFVTLPVAEAVYYSFFHWNGYGVPSRFAGADNYLRLWHDPIFYRSLLNNFWVVLASAFVQVPLALGLALLIADRSRTSAFFRAVFFLPYVLGEVAAGLIWRYLCDGQYGLIATVGGWLGVETPPVLATAGWALVALLLAVVWKYFGFHLTLFIAGRQAVPEEVVESAQIDGASRWQTTWYITLPLLRPVAVLSLFFSLLGSLQIFDLIVALTDGGPSHSTHSAVSYLYTFGIKRMRASFGSAVGVSLFVVCVLVMIFYKRLFMREREER